MTKPSKHVRMAIGLCAILYAGTNAWGDGPTASELEPVFTNRGMSWYPARVELPEEHEAQDNCQRRFGENARLVSNRDRFSCYIETNLAPTLQAKLQDQLDKNEALPPSKQQSPGAITAKYKQSLRCPMGLHGGTYDGQFICLVDLKGSEVCPKGSSNVGGSSVLCSSSACAEGLTDLSPATGKRYLGCVACPLGKFDAKETLAWQTQRGGAGGSTYDYVLCAAKDDAATAAKRKNAEAEAKAQVEAKLEERKASCSDNAMNSLTSEFNECVSFQHPPTTCIKAAAKNCVSDYSKKENGGCGAEVCPAVLESLMEAYDEQQKPWPEFEVSADKATAFDPASKLTWTTSTKRQMAWADADKHCRGLSGGGWRLPTQAEFTAAFGSGDKLRNVPFSLPRDDSYWSSTPGGSVDELRWAHKLEGGGALSPSRSTGAVYMFYALCVRESAPRSQ